MNQPDQGNNQMETMNQDITSSNRMQLEFEQNFKRNNRYHVLNKIHVSLGFFIQNLKRNSRNHICADITLSNKIQKQFERTICDSIFKQKSKCNYRNHICAVITLSNKIQNQLKEPSLP